MAFCSVRAGRPVRLLWVVSWVRRQAIREHGRPRRRPQNALGDRRSERRSADGDSVQEVRRGQHRGQPGRDPLWIPNQRTDHLTIYPQGDPRLATTAGGGGIGNSFSVAVDEQGAAWVTNQAISAGRGSVTRIGPGPGYAVSGPIEDPSLLSPMTVAVDRGGNKRVADFVTNSVTRIDGSGNVADTFPPASIHGGWGLAVDETRTSGSRASAGAP